MSLVAYKATCEQASAAARRAQTFANLAKTCAINGAPAPWALKIAQKALQDTQILIAIAQRELDDTVGSK